MSDSRTVYSGGPCDDCGALTTATARELATGVTCADCEFNV